MLGAGQEASASELTTAFPLLAHLIHTTPPTPQFRLLEMGPKP